MVCVLRGRNMILGGFDSLVNFELNKLIVGRCFCNNWGNVKIDGVWGGM